MKFNTLIDILRGVAETAYSSKDENGNYLYSLKKLKGDSISNYDLRKIAKQP